LCGASSRGCRRLDGGAHTRFLRGGRRGCGRDRRCSPGGGGAADERAGVFAAGCTLRRARGARRYCATRASPLPPFRRSLCARTHCLLRCDPRPPCCRPQILAKYPPPDAEEFARWFPGLERCAKDAQARACLPLHACALARAVSADVRLACAGARRAAPRRACAWCASPTRATRRMCSRTKGWARVASPCCSNGAAPTQWSCWRCNCPAAARAPRSLSCLMRRRVRVRDCARLRSITAAALTPLLPALMQPGARPSRLRPRSWCACWRRAWQTCHTASSATPSVRGWRSRRSRLRASRGCRRR
jgi:hypothetical protein